MMNQNEFKSTLLRGAERARQDRMDARTVATRDYASMMEARFLEAIARFNRGESQKTIISYIRVGS